MITTCHGQHARELGEIYRAILLLGIILINSSAVFSQVETATVSGVITDQSGGVIIGADVQVTNADTNVTFTTTSNHSGTYLVTGLKPGRYRVHVAKEGFKGIDLTDLILNVQDSISRNFSLQVGSVSETVSVEGGGLQINTQDATVSTVIDRQFVENMPLNGRSFQTLLTLTPGVVLTQTNANSQGQFSVNGQRTDANYFTVDGVSANFGMTTGTGSALYQAAGGSIPAFSAAGGTNSLVSVDAMQEFRVQTSTFAPEFGNTPGGQISIVTRSGTNQFHGTLFEYFRNDVLDANDWFANKNRLRKPPERQNDFGGVFGGPVLKDKTFFFFSYEGLRLRQPLVQQTTVPSAASRQAAPSQIQPFLQAFPIPNGQDLGNGLAQFAASYSNPSSLDAYSVRMDYVINSRFSLLGRYNYAPSETAQRLTKQALSNSETTQFRTHTLTLGLNARVANEINNELRANYSNSRVVAFSSLDQFGGAVPLSGASVFPAGLSSSNGRFQFFVTNAGGLLVGKNTTNEQRQVNVVDGVQIARGAHQLKFGVDYRWLAPFASPLAYGQTAVFSGMTGPTGALSGVAQSVSIVANQGSALLSQNFSLYAQDSWKASPRFTFTYGLRWDLNPALRGKNSSSDPFTVQGLDNPATMTLASRGTPLYNTTYGNVAPRVGAAYVLTQRQAWESVLRGGFGVFYDLGTGSLGAVTSGFPFTAGPKRLDNVPFPLTPQQAAPPGFSLNPPVSLLFVADPNLKLPRSYQWNVAAEQSLGANQTVSATYVAALGRDLLRVDSLLLILVNPAFGSVTVTRNTATSDYHALQLKFQRRLSRSLQALTSYTLSHSIDIGSNDFFALSTPTVVADPKLDLGNSDFDVRHSFTAAVSYDVPSPTRSFLARSLLSGWSFDNFWIARSALPVNIRAANPFVNGVFFSARPNVVPGVPFYLYVPQYPGGRAFNPAAFTKPFAGQQGNFGRNVLRGFGAWQTDFAVRRQFHLTERWGLQFRAEFFNLFNHPNFGDPTFGGSTTLITNPLFGQSTQSLASSLGTGGANGGLNPLYQVGGPRSIQLALRLTF